VTTYRSSSKPIYYWHRSICDQVQLHLSACYCQTPMQNAWCWIILVLGQHLLYCGYITFHTTGLLLLG